MRTTVGELVVKPNVDEEYTDSTVGLESGSVISNTM
jgi:hypothetical protein